MLCNFMSNTAFLHYNFLHIILFMTRVLMQIYSFGWEDEFSKEKERKKGLFKGNDKC
jgi:hypothetical protein